MTSSTRDARPSADDDLPALHGSRLGAAITALMMGVFLAALDGAILASALPTIVSEFDATEHIAWVVTSYILFQTMTTPIWGKLGDLFGRKRIFMIAIATFFCGSLLSGASGSLWMLIGFRALQGIGAGGLMVNAQATIADLVEPARRSTYLAINSSIFGATSVIGPLIGGFLVDALDWRWIFYINIPVALAALILAALTIPQRTRRSSAAVDYLGALLLLCTVGSIILLTSLGGTTIPWSSPMIPVLGGVAALGATLFVLRERRAADPIIPPRLFRNATFRISTVLAACAGIGMLGIGTFIPFYFQFVQGMTPTTAGLMQLPQTAGMLTGNMLTGHLFVRSRHVGTVAIVGGLLMTAGLVGLSSLRADTPLWAAGVVLLVYGLGLGVTMQLGLALSQNSAPRADVGAATAVATFSRSMGMSLGSALLGAVLAGALAAAFAASGDQVPTDLTPADLALLDPVARARLVQPYASGIHTVYTVAIGLGVVTLTAAAALFLQGRRAMRIVAPPATLVD
ncbi:MAG: MFS transporter [Microbacterium sp.]|nr:MFS transporter [Microbacterium sp.]